MVDVADIEKTILKNLQYNEEYSKKVSPFLLPEYFDSRANRQVYEAIQEHIAKFNTLPSKEVLDIEFQSKDLGDIDFADAINVINDLAKPDKDKTDRDWLLKKTEEFCQDKSLYIALRESISIADGSNKNLSKTSIPDLLDKALSVCFDTSIGHDYLADSDRRYEYYNLQTHKVVCHIDILNKITNGGVERKTVNCLAAGTGVGKSSLMCDLAANYIMNGYNVLYITLEMSEENIAKHIDAKLLDVPLQDVPKLGKDVWESKINKLKKKTNGVLKIKEYPTATAHVGNFRFLIKELRSKQQFVPDIIFIDYLNICASSRIKAKTDTYNYVKSICEEVRGLAAEQNVVVWTATQLNRQGQNNSDIDMTNISESMGGPQTFDFLLALVSNENLANMNQVMMVQLKNRYADLFNNKNFCIGVDRSKMKFYDLQNPTVNVNVSFGNNMTNAQNNQKGPPTNSIKTVQPLTGNTNPIAFNNIKL